MNPRRRVIDSLVALSAVFAISLGFGWSDASAASISYAGLVVRHDDDRMAYAYVGFVEEQINGIELLKRSGLDVVTVSFGGLGEGVCSIDEHGCPSTSCRTRVCQGPRDDDPFWQYFRQASPGAGDWASMVLGGSGTRVGNGDIDGWEWTGTNPHLPPLTLEEIARRAGYTGVSFDDSATPNAGAVLRREGSIQASDERQSAVAIAAAAGILIVGVIATLAITRSRRAGQVVD